MQALTMNPMESQVPIDLPTMRPQRPQTTHTPIKSPQPCSYANLRINTEAASTQVHLSDEQLQAKVP